MQALKDQGNEAFKKGDYATAVELYTAALSHGADHTNDSIYFHCYLNRALSRLKLEQFAIALDDVEAALSIQPTSAKALYRKAVALNGIGSRSKALGVLIDLCKIDPDQTKLCRPLMNSILQSEQNVYRLASIVAVSRDLNLIESDLKKIASLLSNNQSKAAEVSQHQQFLEFLFNTASKSLCDIMTANKNAPIGDLCLSVLVQIIRSKKASMAFFDMHILADMVKRSGFSHSWLSLLCEIVLSNQDVETVNSLIMTLHCGLESEFFCIGSLDADCCNRIIDALCKIAMSSAERLYQVRSVTLLPILTIPSSARFSVNIFKILTLFSECKVETDQLESDSIKPAVPSTEFLDLAQSIVFNLLKSPETASSGLSALFLILAAVPTAASGLVAESERLSTLLELASGSDAHRGDAIAVLALASNDASVRNAICKADYSYLFIDALESDDHLVASYACLALSKLAVSNEIVRSEILQSQVVLKRACNLLSCTDSVRICTVSMEAVLYLSFFCESKLALVSRQSLLSKFMNSLESLKQESSLRFAIAQTIASLSTCTEDLQFESELDAEKSKLEEMASKFPGRKDNLDLSVVAGSSEEIMGVKLALLNSGVGRILCDIVGPNETRSPQLDEAVGKAFVRLSSVQSHCGRLVSEGALTALLRIIHLKENPRPSNVLYNCRLSIARLCIRTNPELIGSRSQSALANVCLKLIEAKHELHEYEGLLALTNAASVNEEIRTQILGLKGWQRLLTCLSSSNELIQTAALESLANLIPCQSAMDRFAKHEQAAEQDIKIFLMFARSSENERTISAALSGLAMMSSEPRLASKIAALGGADVASQILKRPAGNDIYIRATALLDNLQNASR